MNQGVVSDEWPVMVAICRTLAPAIARRTCAFDRGRHHTTYDAQMARPVLFVAPAD